MRVLRYKVRFLTPAFLGDAEQNGRWRTPPIKALLRQFWRVAYAAECGFAVDVDRMRHEEGVLFGHAWLGHDVDSRGKKVPARKSLVRIRLDGPVGTTSNVWDLGTQRGVAPLPIDLATSYAWFGLVNRGRGEPDRTAIKVGIAESERELRVAVPDEHAETLKLTLRLVHAFGVLGSRSRGAWGAVQLVEGDDAVALDEAALVRHARRLSDCLKADWAMSLARDERGLCLWEGPAKYKDWVTAMRDVASERKRVRGALKVAPNLDLRIALGFAGKGRMPSPLRWKLFDVDNGNLGLRIFAMPHKLPAVSGKSLSTSDLDRAWTLTCQALDQSTIVERAAKLAA